MICLKFIGDDSNYQLLKKYYLICARSEWIHVFNNWLDRNSVQWKWNKWWNNFVTICVKTLNLLRNPVSFNETKEDIQLTNRETEILEHLSKGLNYNEIANNLIISPSTVRKHIENIYKKLQVHNKIEAIQKAQKNNLL